MATPSTHPIPRKLWEHPDPESTNMGKFRRALEKHTGLSFAVSLILSLMVNFFFLILSVIR